MIQFHDELAADAGGPLKEIFTFIKQDLQSLLREGDDHNKMLKLNWTAYLDHLYFYVGQIISLAICKWGALPQFFLPYFRGFTPGGKELFRAKKLYYRCYSQ